MNPTFLQEKFNAALTYARYIETGTAEQQRRWAQVDARAQLTAGQCELIESFTREMKMLIVSGVWCGDCIQQIPLIARIADANAKKIQLRILDRDQHLDLSEQLRINAGLRIPVALLMAEDFELCSIYGERTLSRYRAMARRQLGPSCPTGIVVPDEQELAATLQDWLDEFERVQLMLRLSPRLREKHRD